MKHACLVHHLAFGSQHGATGMKNRRRTIDRTGFDIDLADVVYLEFDGAVAHALVELGHHGAAQSRVDQGGGETTVHAPHGIVEAGIWNAFNRGAAIAHFKHAQIHQLPHG